MELKIIIDGDTDNDQHTISVPKDVIDDATDYFAMIDNDLDQGFQMSRTWVEKPDLIQRCQIVGDRILTALETENTKLGTLMAAYILAKVPNAYALHLNYEGDMTLYELETR